MIEGRQQATCKPALTPSLVTHGALQRKCDCGNQTAFGNECEECKMHRLQRKLSIGASNDPLELEADRVADEVMAMSPNRSTSHTLPRIQRFTGQSSAGDDTVPASVVSVLASSGRPLDLALQEEMGNRFGYDFSRVRVHTGTEAERSAQDVSANAYTVGHDIIFGAGEFAPKSSRGRYLLAHELTHVVQQKGINANTRKPYTKKPCDPVSSGDMGQHVSAGNNASGVAGTIAQSSANASVLLQRYHHKDSCTPTDLSGVIWPGDSVMRLMVGKAIRVLSASPISPMVSALFPKYFISATPAVATILGVFKKIESVLAKNNYWYECEHACGPDEAAYVRARLRYLGLNPNIHLCLNHMSGYSLECNASLILHELSHYAAHVDDKATGCGSCSTSGCPASLSAGDALDNSYSYANFALELYPLAV